MIRPILPFAFLLLAGAASARAEAAPVSAPAQTCSIHGWSIDRGSAGPDVRVRPSPTARVIGRLAPYGFNAGGGPGTGSEFGSSFEIVAARRGWFYIRGHFRATVAFDPESSGQVWEPLEGWIGGAVIRFAIQGEKGFERPGPGSRTIPTGRGRRTFTRMLDCAGEFARVAWREGGNRRSAWFRRP